MTQHFVEAVCGDDTEFRLVCTEPENCGQDGEGCEFLEEWKSLDPNEAITKPAREFGFGRLEVKPSWVIHPDGEELWFYPVEPSVDPEKVKSFEWTISENNEIVCALDYKQIGSSDDLGTIEVLSADIAKHIQEFHKEN